MSPINSDFSEVQELANAEIFKINAKDKVSGGKLSSAFREICNYGDSLLRNALGEMGGKFFQFVNNVDLEHPDLNNIVTIPQCTLLLETLKLYNYAKTNNLNVVLPQIKTIATKDLREPFKDLDDPKKNQRLIRLLKNREDKRSVRANKIARKIELRSFYENFRPENWQSQIANSFKRYIRNNRFREVEIENARKKAERYSSLGCSSLSGEINRVVSLLRSRADENFMGFQRATMNDVAYILARIHGFEYVLNPFQSKSELKIKESKFGFNFEIKDGANTPPYIPREYEYTPRAYPVHEFQDIMGEKTAKTIDYLENLPELDGKSAFDHYAVVVPSIEPACIVQKNSFINKAGEKISGVTQNETYRLFDIEIIKNDAVAPVLIAERDGKCYFVSYFERKS